MTAKPLILLFNSFHGYKNRSVSLQTIQSILLLVMIVRIICGEEQEEHSRHNLYRKNDIQRNDVNFQCQYLQIKHACNATNVLNGLLVGYDERFRPYEGSHATEVRVRTNIQHIGRVNEINMDYTVDLHLMQHWDDPRLANTHPEDLIVSDGLVKNTYFSNSKHAQDHMVTQRNSIMVVKPNGTIVYHRRLNVRASCNMDFHLYPIDTQRCHLIIESFGYTAHDVMYRWNGGVMMSEFARQLPQRDITDVTFTEDIFPYPLGDWSSLKITFVVRRHLYYFFLHLYLPCFIVVVLAWMSFFIPKERVGARIKLAVMALLTIILILNMCGESLPKGSRLKLIDWYLIVSIFFVFVVFMEFIVVLWLTQREMLRVEDLAKKAKLKVSNRSGRSEGNSSFEVEELKEDDEPEDDEDKESQGLANTHEVYFICHFRVAAIDEVSRNMFGLLYLLFNLVYWIIFFNSKGHSELPDR